MNHRRTMRTLIGMLALSAGPAAAAPQFAYGFDLDPISVPRFTEAGFQSVTTCTLARGETTPIGCESLAPAPPPTGPWGGYLAAGLALTGFRVLPLGDASASTDLWADGHRVLPLGAATLRISGLVPGRYDVYLFSADPNPTTTRFELNGQDVGVIAGNSSDPHLDLSATLIYPIDVGASGTLDIRYHGDGFGFGTLNGVAFVVPEPASVLLVMAGLSALRLARRFR